MTFRKALKDSTAQRSKPFSQRLLRLCSFTYFPSESLVHVLVRVAEYFKFYLLVNRCWFRCCGCTVLVLLAGKSVLV